MSSASHTIIAFLLLAAIYVILGIRRCIKQNQAYGYGPQTPAEWVVFHLVMKILVHAVMAQSLPVGSRSQRWHKYLERRWRAVVRGFSLTERRWTYTTAGIKTLSWEVRNRVVYLVLDQPGREEPGWLLVILRGGTTDNVDPSLLDANWLYVLQGRGISAPGEISKTT